MKRTVFLMLSVLLCSFTGNAQTYTWERSIMDGSRTGCITPSKTNVPEAIGIIEKGKYVSPEGKVHGRKSAATKTAKVVLDAQDEMARVKDVIAYSSDMMVADYPESALSNWLIDLLMAKTETLVGKKVHMGITNFGGIRADMPEGEIILDDMLSMFPFRNHLVYVEHTGKQIRAILESMASHYFQVLGGVRVVAEGGKLLSVEIGGEPLDDDKVYGLATISFLLKGGDGLTLDKDAVSITQFKDVQIIDAVLEYVHAQTAAGRPIEYKTDGRVVIKDFKKSR